MLVLVGLVEQLDQVLGEEHSVADVVGAAAPLPDLVLLSDEADAAFVTGAVGQRALTAGGGYGVHDARRRNGLHVGRLAVARRLAQLARQQPVLAARMRTVPPILPKLLPTLGQTSRHAHRQGLLSVGRLADQFAEFQLARLLAAQAGAQLSQ